MYNVLSLFDGISCGQVALNRAGIPINKYYASEIDQRAIKVTQRNWPKTIQFGDVTRIKKEHFMSEIDILIGGSPCQGFSFAGKQLNFEDPRSKLFFEFVRLRDELKPKYFFLENVRMKKESQDVISRYLGVEPIFINSIKYSAQTRKRLYWSNIEYSNSDFESKLCIQDIIHECENCNKNLYLKEHEIERAKTKHAAQNFKGYSMGAVKFPTPIYGKSKCLLATKIKGDRSVTHIDDGKGIRVLNQREYERLQGLPDGYTHILPPSTAWHSIGNGWQVDTIVEFFKNIPS